MKRGPKRFTAKQIRRAFWAKVNKHGPIVRPELGRCWLWTGATANGYGQFVLSRDENDHKRTHHNAHRAAWILSFGPISGKLNVCHKCDNPLCVRPSHMFLGTYLDNNRDRVRKERGNAITAKQIAAMRALYRLGYSLASVARQMGVYIATVSKNVRDLDIYKGKPPVLTNKQLRAVPALFRLGWTGKAIAVLLGVSYSSIWNVITKRRSISGSGCIAGSVNISAAHIPSLTVKIIRVDRTSYHPQIWCLTLACGHRQWIRIKQRRPRTVRCILDHAGVEASFTCQEQMTVRTVL